MSFNFSGKRFVVTGASSGIGRCIVLELARSGAEILAIARRQEELQELEMQYPLKITVAVVDVTDEVVLQSAVEKFAQDGPISGSVHAAGINKFTPLRAFNKDVAKKIMDVCLWAGVDLIRFLSKKRYIAKNASHVLIASVAALEGRVGLTGYCAAKAGIINVSRSMALELAPLGIRVNTVSPGWIKTEMTEGMESCYPGGIDAIINEHPLGIGDPEDVSNAVLFLLSGKARWITGSNIVVDGGYLA